MAGDTNPIAGPSGTNTNALRCGHCGFYFPTYQNLLRHYEQIYASSGFAQANQNAAYMNNGGNSVQAENRKDKKKSNIHEKPKMYPINTDINRHSHVKGTDMSHKTPVAKLQTQGNSETSKHQVLNQTEHDIRNIGMVEFSTNQDLLQILSKGNPMQHYRNTTSVNNPNVTKGAPMTVNKSQFSGFEKNTSPLHRDVEHQKNENISHQKNQPEKAETQTIATTFLLCKICQKFFVDKEEALAHNKNEHPNVGNCFLEAQVPKPLANIQSQPHDARDINNIERKNMRCLVCHEVCAMSETSNHRNLKHPELRHLFLFVNYEAERRSCTDNQHTNQHANHQKYQDDAEFRTATIEPNEFNMNDRNKIQSKTYVREKRKINKEVESESSDSSGDTNEECSKAKISKHRKDGEKDVDRQKNLDRVRSRSNSLLLKYKNNDTVKSNRNKDSTMYWKKKEKKSRRVSDSESSSVSTCESSDETLSIKPTQKRKKNFVKSMLSDIFKDRASNGNRKNNAYESKGDKNGDVMRRRNVDSSEDSSDSNSQNDLNLKKFLPGFNKRSDVKKHLKMLLSHIKNEESKKRAKIYNLYKCICDLHFLSEEKLCEHLKIGNHDIKSKSCKVCKRKFTKKILRTHIKIHHKKLKLEKNDFKIVTVESLHFTDTDSDSDSREGSPYLKHKGNMPSELLEKTNTFESQDKLKQIENESSTKTDFAQSDLELNKEDDDKLTVQLFKCVICDIHFLTESTFRQHLQKKVHDIKTKSKCKFCDLYFTQKSLTKHEKEHHQELNYNLENFQIIESKDFCESGQEVLPKILLKRLPYPQSNEKIKNQVNLYKCEPCDIHFLHEMTWKQHLQGNVHCMRTKTRCPTCFLFFSKKSLTKHIEWHHEKNNLCANDFNILKSSNFPRYSSEHTETSEIESETSWKENSNDGSSNNKSDPSTEQNAKKRVCKINLYKCDLCDVFFLNEKAFKQHFRQLPEHSVQTKTKCNYCQFNFSSRSLKVHVENHHKNMHLKEDDFEIIKSSDLPKSYFERHEHNSTPVTYSSKDMNDASSSLRHLDMFQKDNTNLDHTSYNNVLYKCEHCHLCFLSRSSLENHLYVNDHDMKNTVECHICQYIFSNNSIPRHLQVHHEFLKLRREDFALYSEKAMIKSHSKSSMDAKKDMGYRSKHHGFVVKKDKSVNNQFFTSKTESYVFKKLKSINYLKLITNKLYKCSICNIHFVLQSTLIMHMNVGKHKYRKMVTCRICQYTFSLITFSRHDTIQHKKLGLKREDLVIIDDVREKKNNETEIKNCSVKLTTLQSSLITTTNMSYQQEVEGYLPDDLLLTHDNMKQNKESTRNSVIVRSTATPESSVDTGNGNFANTGVHFLQDMITKEYSHLPDVKSEPIDTEHSSIFKEDIDTEANLFALDKISCDGKLSDKLESEPDKTVTSIRTKKVSAKSNTNDHCNTSEKLSKIFDDSQNSELNMLKESSLYSIFYRLKEFPQNNDMETIEELKSLAYDSKLTDTIFKEKIKSFLAKFGDRYKKSGKIKSEDTGKDKPIENEKVALRNSTRSPNCNMRRQSVQDFDGNVLNEEGKLLDTDECITVKVAYFPFVKKENNSKGSKAGTCTQDKEKSRDRTREESDTNLIKANDDVIPEAFLEISITNGLSDSVEETNKRNEAIKPGNNTEKNNITGNDNNMLSSLIDLGGEKEARNRDDDVHSSSLCERKSELGSVIAEKREEDMEITETVESSVAIKDYGIQYLSSNPDVSPRATIATEIVEDKKCNSTKQSNATCESNSTDVCSDKCREESSVKENNHDNNVINLNTTIDNIIKTTLENMVLHSVVNKNKNCKDKTIEDEQTKLLNEQTLNITVNAEQDKPKNCDIVSSTAVFAVENSKSLESIENVIKPKTDGLFLFEDSLTDVNRKNCGNVFRNIQVTDVKTTSDVFNEPVKVKEEIVDIDSDNDFVLDIPDYLKVRKTNEVIEISSDEE